MMRTLTLLLALVAAAAPLAAQNGPRFEIGGDVSYWRLDHGTATVGPTTRPAAGLRAAVLIPSRRPATLGFGGSYAPEDGMQPGLLALSGEFSKRLLARDAAAPNLFVGMGAGIMRFSSEEQWSIINRCRPENGCMAEGISYAHGEWQMTMAGSIGADLRVLPGLVAQPAVSVVKPFGAEDGRARREAMLRVGISLAWRP